MLKSIVIDYNKEHLQSVIKMIEFHINDVDNLESYAKKIHKQTNLRVTVVNEVGKVIAESDANKQTMDNHASRYEIMASNNQEFADITRYSHTLNVDFLYVAKKTSYKGKKIYLRLSISLGKIMDDFYSLWYKLVFAFFIVVVIAFYITKQMNDRIVYDIEQITKFLNEISEKNYKAVIKTKYFYEFLHISLLLKNLVKKLSNRDKQKRKYTAKLRLMNKQRNDILSSISHEFKNPIASIIGYSQTLRDDPDVNIKIREKFLDKITSNGEKISKMLDRLALSVKLDNNDLDINKSEFNLKSLVQEVALNIGSKYRDREIIVNAEDTVIYADKTMIELVLINLVDNALKYSQLVVEIDLHNNILSVEDQGIGIRPEHIELVTSKFYRVDKNSWDNSMGLGLAMVSYILKVHKSLLVIESEYSKGSVFSFDLESMLKK